LDSRPLGILQKTTSPDTGGPMKGNVKVLECLNHLLADELTAINQYMVHSEMCDNWGYEKLHGAIERRAREEMHHAESLIARIIFFEGIPIVSKLNEMHIGKTVKDMMVNDLESEAVAVKGYNDGIRLATSLGDDGPRDLLTSILKDEERHVDWLEAQGDQIEQMGLENYLSVQTEEGK
jgi:bacterioferritin